MCRAWLFQRFVPLGLFLFFFLYKAIAIELHPIRPIVDDDHITRLGKRADVSALDLRSSETFFWGGAGSSDAVLANFTVYMPGEFENIVTMERFYGMLKSVNCTNHDMTLAFKDDVTFAYAQRVWDWVNGADNHTFVMVAGVGDCEWNRRRQPFNVSTIAYDEDKNVARLKAVPTKWETIAHSYDLDVGHVPMTDSRLPARDLSKDLSLDLSCGFPFLIKATRNGLSTALECTNCVTTGKINLELKVSQTLFVPTGASIRISPQGVSAKAEIKLTESGELTDAIEWEKSVRKIPLNSITIPGVVNIGPNLDISVGFEISALEGSASISGGATASLKDSAVLELNLLDPLSNTFSGWEPDVKPLPVVIDARVSGGLQIYAIPAVKLVAEVLGQGFEIGLDLKMPYIGIKAEAIVNKAGACNTQKAFGVEVGANFGAELAVKAANVNDPAKELLELKIATIDFPLGDKLCFAFGEEGTSAAAPPNAGGPGAPPPSVGPGTPPPSSGVSQPSEPGSTGGTSCKSSNGLSGTCIPTDTCAGDGGSSEPGHCPGADNIQCCTHPSVIPTSPEAATVPKNPSGGKACKVKSGLSGECISTDACSTGGGQSEAGHCPGPKNIQCCTYATEPPSSGGKDSGDDEGEKPSDDNDEELNDDDDDDDNKGSSDDDDDDDDEKLRDNGDEEPSDDDEKKAGDGDDEESTDDNEKKAGDDDDDEESSDDDSCKISDGALGTCISTTDCSSNGGKSEAGHCPGATNIQCCTYSSCNVAGQKGQCQSTTSCSGTSTPGYCPGADNIQCCTSS